MRLNFPIGGESSGAPEPGQRESAAARWWRTLEEHANDPRFQERLWNEFPSQIEAITDPVERRTFLRVMGASLALAGMTACTRQPEEKIVPYVRQPEQLIPGVPLFFATAMSIGGLATGLLVESHEGRPTKIEGNPLHPASLGATDIFAQAAILDLYDPARARTVMQFGEIRPWPAFLGAIRAALAAQQPLKGAGLRILTQSVGSPTLAAQLQRVLAAFPAAKWHQWDPVGRTNTQAGARLAFGQTVDLQYRIDQADVILALDADFLGCGAASVRYARDFAARRRPHDAQMNRLYVAESMPTSTGARADHRWPARPSDIGAIARLVASGLGIFGAEGERVAPGDSRPAAATGAVDISRWTTSVVRDLQAHRGASLVIAGETQPAAVHALAHAINHALGNVGRTVVYTDPVEPVTFDQVQSIRDLSSEMKDGAVDVLVILGGNPVYTTPPDLGFAQAMARVPLRVHLSSHDDETAALCQWHIPEAHFLEAWSDGRAYDGTASIVQPLIAPLYGGKSAHDVVAALSDRPEQAGYDIVRDYWVGRTRKTDFERNWRRWLHDGIVPDTQLPARTVTPNLVAIGSASQAVPQTDGIEINFRLDPSVLDGRFANNGWLQELPKPITKLTWDNAVIVSPATAEKLKLRAQPSVQGGEHGQISSDVVEVRARGASVRGPIFAVAGHPDDCVTLHLGYGRSRAGHLGTGAGFNANIIRASDALWSDRGVEIVPTRDRYPLACTQYHHLMEGRGLVRATTAAEFLRNPASVRPTGAEGDTAESPPQTLTLYPNYAYEGYKWGMAIDINACIGCNACVLGCQAENNIPVVGKDQVLRGREMHWLRVDTYYRGPLANPETYFQPVPCMHCENAPCEVVCPVGATVHSYEGLNDMVYNRCVGTRYCSNNCPYKVRRFNFLLYQDWSTPSLKLLRNPDVTVRSRGVMEKCTYCVQRINAAKIESEKQDRPVADGEIKTACQQVCPADAIVFGDLNDPNSRVARLQADARNYSLLGELNTRPRTTYLAALRNVNPELGE